MKTVTFATKTLCVVCPETAVRAVVVTPAKATALVHIGEVTFSMMIDEAKLFDQKPATMSLMDRQTQLASAIYNGSPVHAIPVTSIKSGEGGGAGGTTPKHSPTPPSPQTSTPEIS